MAMAGVLVVGGATNLVTELIKSVLEMTSTAVRCQEECLKLEEELRFIRPGVEQIELQLQELHSFRDPNVKQNLKQVVEWLKAALDHSKIKVHESNTASRITRFCGCYGSYILSKKITAQNTKITELARERVTLTLLPGSMLNVERVKPKRNQENSMLGAERSEYPASEWQKWNQEKNDILERADATTRSEGYIDGSVHGGYGSAGSPFSAEDLGQHSSHHLNHSRSDPQFYHSPHHMNHPDPQFYHSTHHLNHPDPHQFYSNYTTPY